MILAYLFVLLVLGVYSYSQIDLNLTLLRTSWFLAFQHQMIQLGYFNRQLSTLIFGGLILSLSALYFFLFHRGVKVALRQLAIILVGVAVLGLVSYSAFSHDLFNYIFDARILIYHHANPYNSTALMFPGDDWIRFMQWTHRTYPYGPTFLPLTLVPYLLGLNKFILTLFWFKAFFVAAYLGCCYMIYKWAGKSGAIFFALNPLVIIEAVVSPHLDSVMLFFALLGGYLFTKKRKLAGVVSWLMSVGIKYVTLTQFPGLSLGWLAALAFAGAGAQIVAREFLPHYFLVPLGFAALLPDHKKTLAVIAAISVVLLGVRYFPFLLTGQW